MSNESNAVKSIFSKVKKQNNELKNKNELIVDESILDRTEVLSKYEFNYEIEEETLEFLKEQTYQIHLTSNTFYTKLGKIFLETQEKLANNKNGVFRKWFENIGFKKDFVYDNIMRYKYIVGNSDNKKVEIESLPVSLTYEISKESCPDFIREKVISGEIKTQSALKKAIKEVQQEEPKEVIQEAEIVEDYETLMKIEFEGIIEDLSKAEKVVNYNKSNLDALVKIRKILHGME